VDTISSRHDFAGKLLVATLTTTTAGSFIGLAKAQTKRPMLEREILTSEAF